LLDSAKHIRAAEDSTQHIPLALKPYSSIKKLYKVDNRSYS